MPKRAGHPAALRAFSGRAGAWLHIGSAVCLFLLLVPQAQSSGPQAPGVIRVGLGWLRLPEEVRITPREGGAVMRTCAICAATRVASSISFTAQGSLLHAPGAKPLAGPVTIEGDYEVTMPGRPALHSRFPATLRARGGRIRMVLRIPLEKYVALALAGESADSTSDAALQAMAVVVRSYAVSVTAAGRRHAAEEFDLCDSTHCQLLRFDDAAQPRLLAAAVATEGELLWYRGEPATTYYSRNCAGTSEDAARLWPDVVAPYLRSHPDPFCLVHGRNEWSVAIGKDELASALRDAGMVGAGNHISSLRILERTPSGRVARIEIRGASSRVMTGEQFRTALGRVPEIERLQSNTFDVSDAGERFILHGYGAGHGAGLCQAGAEEMGAEEKSYREILAFYYPGTTVGLTAQGLAWVRLGGEGLDLFTTRPDADAPLVPRAERLLHAAETVTGWKLDARPELRVYPSVRVYWNAAGEPGWVAASTRGRVVRMEPQEVLRAAGALDSTLRHEFLHLLVESRARAGIPLWFREGLVLYLGGENATPADATAAGGRVVFAWLERALAAPVSAAAQRSAYRQAQHAVAGLVETRGRAEVLSWLERGLPPDLAAAK